VGDGAQRDEKGDGDGQGGGGSEDTELNKLKDDGQAIEDAFFESAEKN
jgi:hypothetical protein